MASWGIVTTIKAPLPEIEAFVAHHLDLGAARIYLHLDDPDTATAHAFDNLPQVDVTLCDAAYWQDLNNGRPSIHELRQTLNVQRVYKTCPLDWLAHIDGDEFIWAKDPVGQALDKLAPSDTLCRLEPWEALHTPGMTDDIFTARWFRKPVKARKNPSFHAEIFDPFADCLKHGILSHSAGKCFFRTGVEGLQPRIHSAEIDDQKMEGGRFNKSLRLLHFHAQDPHSWKAALPYRLETGAYRFNPGLVDLLTEASPDDIDMFYHHVMAPGPMLTQDWERRGATMRATLHLKEKIAKMRG